MPRPPALRKQCAQIGWPLSVEYANRAIGIDGWLSASGTAVGPEELVLERFRAAGQVGCWCEGGSINLLMKAATLEVLARRNAFNDRQDAVRRFFEAQCTILSAYQAEVIASIAIVNELTFSTAAAELCTDAFIRSTYPRVTAGFLLLLWGVLGRDRLSTIATKFFEKPYDYRAGWPDLTLVDGCGVHFVEVKTSDKMHPSQVRFAKEVAAPLGLRCAVYQVKATPDHSSAV